MFNQAFYHHEHDLIDGMGQIMLQVLVVPVWNGRGSIAFWRWVNGSGTCCARACGGGGRAGIAQMFPVIGLAWRPSPEKPGAYNKQAISCPTGRCWQGNACRAFCPLTPSG